MSDGVWVFTARMDVSLAVKLLATQATSIRNVATGRETQAMRIRSPTRSPRR